MRETPEEWAHGLLDRLVATPREGRMRLLAELPPPAFRTVAETWFWQAHGGQVEPAGAWRLWLLMAGRGFGKTRAGAEWVLARVRAQPGARIALVGGNLGEVERVMVARRGAGRRRRCRPERSRCRQRRRRDCPGTGCGEEVSS